MKYLALVRLDESHYKTVSVELRPGGHNCMRRAKDVAGREALRRWTKACSVTVIAVRGIDLEVKE